MLVYKNKYLSSPRFLHACGGAVESVMGTRLLKHKHAKSEDKPVTDTTLKCWHPKSEFSWRDGGQTQSTFTNRQLTSSF